MNGLVSPPITVNPVCMPALSLCVCVCACMGACVLVFTYKCLLVDQSGPWQAYPGQEEVCEETAEGEGEGG